MARHLSSNYNNIMILHILIFFAVVGILVPLEVIEWSLNDQILND